MATPRSRLADVTRGRRGRLTQGDLLDDESQSTATSSEPGANTYYTAEHVRAVSRDEVPMKVFRPILALLLVCAGMLFTPSAHAQDGSSVSVLHGVPDATVDVWANGKPLLTNFAPGTLTEPQMLPVGSYDLKVVKAGDPADAPAVIEAKGVQVPAGKNITVVAHLDADGKPKLTPFVNDTSTLAAGKARLTVRHVAAAPAVDVRANGTPALKNLSNPNEATAVVDAGTISADVVLAGTSTVALGPADVQLAEGTHTIVYAWGSAEAKNLKLAVQTIKGMNGHPEGVPAGDGGQAADNGYARAGLIGLSALLAAGLVLSLRRHPAVGRSSSGSDRSDAGR